MCRAMSSTVAARLPLPATQPGVMPDEDAREAAAAHGEDLVGELAAPPRRGRATSGVTQLGRELVGHRPEQLLGEARLRDRRDHVALDVVLRALDREHVREADEAHLRGAVVGLAEVAEDAGAPTP